MPRIGRRVKRPWWKTALIGAGVGCGSTLVILGLVFVIIWARLNAEPTTYATAPSTQPTAPPVEQQVDAIEQAVRSGPGKPVQLRVDEAQLNGLLAQGGASGEFRNAQVRFQGSEAVLTGQVLWSGRELHITVSATPTMDGQTPRLVVGTAKVGTLNLPQAAVDKLQAELGRALQSKMSEVRGVQITDIAIREGELVISGATTAQ